MKNNVTVPYHTHDIMTCVYPGVNYKYEKFFFIPLLAHTCTAVHFTLRHTCVHFCIMCNSHAQKHSKTQIRQLFSHCFRLDLFRDFFVLCTIASFRTCGSCVGDATTTRHAMGNGPLQLVVWY